MRTVLHQPSPALAPFVSSIGYFEGQIPHARERALPSGGIQLLINLDADVLHEYGERAQTTGGAVLQGARARAVDLDPADQRAIAWVAFRPGGAYPFFDAPARVARDRLVELGDVWGRDGAVLRERLLHATTPADRLRALDAVLLAHTVRPLEPDRAVTAAAMALHRGVAVAAVADRLGWTTGRLARRFADRIGLTPKRFARVRRFQRLVASVAADAVRGAAVDWAGRAAACGYHDQAHMIHEFREFAGVCPTGYVPRSAADRNHVPLPLTGQRPATADFYNRRGPRRATIGA